MRRIFTTLPALVLMSVFTFAGPLEAQHDVSIEARGVWPYPIGDFGQAGGGQFSFGADLMVGINETFSVYGGISQINFECDGGGECAANQVTLDGDEVEAKGFNLGFRASFPSESGFVVPWFQGAVAFTQLDTTDDSPVADFDGSSEIGFQAGIGVDFALIEDLLYVAPAVRFHSFNPKLTNDFDQVVRHFTTDVGLRLNFGGFRN